MASLAQTFRDLWLAVTARPPAKDSPSEVVVHDPAADRPHDLDDPFFDPKVQFRIADAIAHNAAKKH